MTVSNYLTNPFESYDKLHTTGKFLTATIFVTHGLLDYMTTLVGYYVVTSRGSSFADVEQNSIIANSGPIEMFFIIVGGALLMSLGTVYVYRGNQKIESGKGLNRRLADFLFGLIALSGVFLVLNNMYHLILLF